MKEYNLLLLTFFSVLDNFCYNYCFSVLPILLQISLAMFIK